MKAMNLMIVDDELEIREGIRFLIQAFDGAYGKYRIAAVCASAEEALDALSRQIIHVVLTDIRMAGMDGLKLTEFMQELYPDVKVVILSGYSEFQYAQRALHLKVSEFLLKPVNQNDLQTALDQLYVLWLQSKEAGLFLDHNDFQERSFACSGMLALDLDVCTPETYKRMHQEARSVACELNRVYILKGFATKEAANMIVGIGGDTTEQVEQATQTFCEKVKEFAVSRQIQISIGISEVRMERDYSHYLYLQACTALSNRLLKGGGIWRYCVTGFNESLFQVDLQLIDAAWETLDFPAIYAHVKTLIQSAADRGEIRYLIWTINTIMLTLNEKVKKFNHLDESIPYDSSGFLFKTLWCRNLGDLNDFLLNRVEELLSRTAPERREGQIIYKAKQYIKAHLHEQILLSDISQEVGVTTHYISRMFREKTNETFLEYLTRERMEYAKVLLSNPGVKVYEVAEQVGYGNWKHFSKTFKAATGLNPGEYRSNLYER